MNKGILPFYEPSLDELVSRNKKAERLHFTSSYQEAIEGAEVCFICVGTPPREDGSADTAYVQKAAEQIASHLSSYMVIVNKSTVPVGTTNTMKGWIREVLQQRGAELPFDVISNPEFLKEGSAVQDAMKPDRIIIGSNSNQATKILQNLYSSFTLNHDRIIVMDPLSAELTKYASNAMLATRISFMNEISAYCEKVGANINEVRRGMSSDPRIGYHFLYAGAGYGGSCFPKDVLALQAMAENKKCKTPILQAVHEVNEKQKMVLFKKITNYFAKKGGIEGKTIAIWGLSFKPNTDDIRS